MDFISITDAATFTGKSIQTIRRMIKSQKVRVKKEHTPQGFVYLIEKDSLKNLSSDSLLAMHRTHGGLVTDQAASQAEMFDAKKMADEWKAEMGKFNDTVQKLIEQSQKDKDNFFNLIKSFQERVMQLESHIKLLEAPKKKWWQF